MFLIESKIDPDKDEKGFLDFILGPEFPFYYGMTTKNYNTFIHGILIRSGSDSEGIPASDKAEYWVRRIFDKFCIQNNITYNKLLRACVYSTTYNTGLHGDVHVDHSFPHYNFILYVNDDYTNGETYIYFENDLVKIKPEKYKAIVFNGVPHAQGFCGVGERRVVLVITFN